MSESRFNKKTYTPFQKLDYVLNILKNQKDELDVSEIYKLIKGLNNIDFEDTRRIIDKLLNEGYIHLNYSTTKGNLYRVSFNGYVFIGYEKQRLLDEERLTSIGQMAIATKKYNTRLLWATWCAGIVAALLLLWQVFLYFYPPHSTCDFFYH